MEHALILNIELHGSGFGSPQELEWLGQLASALQDKIELTGVGEFDGHELGQGFCTLYMYGDNVDEMYKAVEDVIKLHKFLPGSFAVKRYGEADDPTAREERIPL